ncbi:uncharacterized protein LOC110465674 [Mizuhopecten yessoensis]|uniref:uncharacterized protein LOC110465674 n=1 Tax=Mizuhopecten yessoensis TaxID=6573 RepID=UPI000B457AAC|nr:uncharacterized protein LOC110465674 [Mizuhopecten yessoensis]
MLIHILHTNNVNLASRVEELERKILNEKDIEKLRADVKALASWSLDMDAKGQKMEETAQKMEETTNKMDKRLDKLDESLTNEAGIFDQMLAKLEPKVMHAISNDFGGRLTKTTSEIILTA